VWLAHSRFRYARFLARQNRRGGPDRAARMLDDVIATARRVGMPVLEANATALARELAIEGNAAVTMPTGLVVDLTPREREILACLVDGLSNANIGRALHVSPNTAANHVRSILAKTGCANRTEAAAWSVRNGIVAP
jgi:DNA-binding NarL/FixJ family response regulator